MDPRRVVEILAPFVSAARKERIETVLAQRLGGLTVVLQNLHDPHNGAAALRSVEGFGLTSLHVVEETEPFRFSSKVTQGCEKWVDIRRHPDFGDCARALHDDRFALYAALPPGAATLDVDALDQGDPARRVALVFGNEHVGLTPAAIAACDGAFTIPMQGMTGSFNLSVSVALAVFACARRRRTALGGGDLDADTIVQLRARWYTLSVDAAEPILERVTRDTEGRG